MTREVTPEAAAFTMADAEAALAGARRFGIHPSLAGIRALTLALGSPQDSFGVVQVSGTNGKTSVTRLTGALLAAHGWRTGTYTSPHLRSYTERAAVAGFDTDARFPAALGMAFTTARAEGLELTEFELLTGAALWLFAELRVELAVLEVGLGGRWDATSVCDPLVAVITGVGLDHTDRLGETVGEIAADKARIIKPASLAVLGPGVAADTAPVFLARAEEVGAYVRAVAEVHVPSPVTDDLTVRYRIVDRPHRPGGETRLDVLGVHAHYEDLVMRAPSYQAANAATAVAAAEAAAGRGLDPATVRRALAQVTFPGRFEVVDAGPPPVVLDGAHNPQAAAVLAEAVVEAWPDADARPVAVLGVLADKDVRGIIEALSPAVAGFVATRPDASRALATADLADIVEAAGGRLLASGHDVAAALAQARSMDPAGILVTGSLYTVGEVWPGS